MKKKLFVLIVVFSLLLGTAGFVMAEENSYGAEGALADQDLTLEEMLIYSIQDEYIAEAEYKQIISTFGSVKPYTNIVLAEGQHIAALEPLFEANCFSIPINDATNRVVVPASLPDGYQVGVSAEINNIAMYDKFLAQDLPDDVRSVFESLKAASENHLSAFQKNLDRSTSIQTTSSSRGRRF
ncbi:hypothetical protein Q5O24_06385 [Eubacteriaceae bacterium ES3]|nr:hypothetical protein Q5O24_06385 [Eubacteriaceae bacterium ES3]